MSDEATGNSTKPESQGEANAEGQEEVSAGQVESSGSEKSQGQEEGSEEGKKPSRAELRIKQLIRERDNARRALDSFKNQKPNLSAQSPESSAADAFSQSQDAGSESDLIREAVRAEMQRGHLEREREEAREFIRSQQGFDPEVDEGLMADIAEENGWDVLAQSNPKKASKLIVGRWKKLRGKTQDSAAKKAQGGSVQGPANPSGGETDPMKRANKLAASLNPSNITPEDRKAMDAAWEALRRSS